MVRTGRAGPPADAVAGGGDHVSGCARGLGFLSRRQPLQVLSKMVDPAQIALGRSEIAYIAFIAVYAAVAWFARNTQAIIGYDHENRTVGQALGAW